MRRELVREPMRSMCLFGLLGFAALVIPAASAQIVELSGGTSSLYQAEGAALSVRSTNYESGISAGTVAGRLVIGAHATYHTPNSVYSIGSEEWRLNLPTDLFDGDHRLLGLGAGIQTTRGALNLQAFAGTSSLRFDTPLFQGVEPDQAAAALMLHYKLTPNFAWSLQVTHVGTSAVLQGLEWKPRPGLTLAASNGFVGSSLYTAESLNYKSPRLDVQASYVDFGTMNQRPGSATDLAPEPIRDNFQVTLRSSEQGNFSLSGGRQNSLVPTPAPTLTPVLTALTPATSTTTPTTGLVSTVDQISGSARLAGIGFSATGLYSTYDGRADVGYMVSGSRALGPRLHVQSSYFASRLDDGDGMHPTTGSIVTTFQEVVNRRLTVSEAITRSNGQTNVSFGGSLLSNLATISADYQTFYVPTRPDNPFQQALVLDLQVHLFGRITLHAGTYVAPDGRLLYTADMKSVGAMTRTEHATVSHSSIGRSILSGRVLDVDGNPISGAAIDIDGAVLVTDSNGNFYLRERKPTSHHFKVLLSDFLDGHDYQIVSKPDTLSSTRPPTPPAPSVIVVKRVGEAAVGAAAQK